MLCINRILLFCLFAFLLSCSGGGVQSGSSIASFNGIGSVTVLSPTSIRISWTKNAQIKSYKIYQNGTANLIGETALDFYVINNLTPETSYTFKVIGVNDSSSFGADKDFQVFTWSRFQGIKTARAVDSSSIELLWDYSFTPQKFIIFYSKDSIPTASSTSNWKNVQAETTANKITIQNLDMASTYYFMVHAIYQEGEKEITTKSLSLTTATSFVAPSYSITPISIGNVPTVYVDPFEDASHGENFFKTTVMWNGYAVSDHLVGKGQIILSSSANFPLGKVENISLKVEYNDGNRNETMMINGISTYIKGQSDSLEIPATTSLPQGSSYMGKVLAKGDFNCDGLDDLAVGLPDMSVASVGVKNSQAGAVIVYYSKEVSPGVTQLNTTGTPTVNPDKGNPQLITFDDLGPRYMFGYSLAAGNFNGDKNGLYTCDDLIVGAPYTSNTYYGTSGTFSSASGGAFLFFGSTKGLSSAAHLSDIAGNASTCDGSISNAICSPVKLYENVYNIPTALTGGQQLKKFIIDGGSDMFGYTVSSVGDFNGDGYDDIAIGAPYTDFDGRLSNLPAGYQTIPDVGAVYLFFGSKYGLGYEYPQATATPNPLIDSRVRYLKIYAPIPQRGARFGSAIAGGADIDGYYKNRLAGPLYYGGSDIVIGAPGFRYENYLLNNYLARSPYTVGTDPQTSSVLSAPAGQGNWWDVGGVSLSSSTNYYGFSQSASVGAAYIYFGRGSSSAPGADETPSRSSFWKCGRRGMLNGDHFSCLFDNTNVKMLTPRKSSAVSLIQGFGSAVAILGSKSRWKENSITTLLNVVPGIGEPAEYFSDSNEDGYADVVVSAPQSTVSGNANAGILQVFYGNGSRVFNPYELYNLYSNANPLSDVGDNSSSCTGFVDSSSATKQVCKPMIIRSGSLAAGSQIGNGHHQFAVGDVTGDGLMDLAVGDSGDNVTGTGSGAAIIFTGIKNQGLSASYKKIYTTNADANDNLGRSVVIGNFNGDLNSDQFAKGKSSAPYVYFPYGDLFVGAPNDEVSRPGGGAVYGFFTHDTSLPSTMNTHDVQLTENLASFSEYGLGDTRLVGDINNDGFTDAVSKITSFDQKGNKTTDLVVYFGSSIGLVTTQFCLNHLAEIFSGAGSANKCYPSINPEQGVTLHDIALPQKILRPSNMDTLWQAVVVDAKDVNGDGFADVMVVPSASAVVKYSVLYFGSRTGLLAVVDPSWLPATGDPQIVSALLSTQNNGVNDAYYPAYSSSRMPFLSGDFNHDGYADLVVGLPENASSQMNYGSGLTYTPDPTGLLGGSVPSVGSGWQCVVPDNSCLVGEPVSHFGSVVVIYGSNRGYQTPRMLGGMSDVVRTVGSLIYETEELATNRACDSSASTTDPTCKYTYIDNPVFENIEYGFRNLGHNFGQSLLIADVNKDGYPDLLVGAPGFEDLSCYAASTTRDYGRVYVYYGSEFGLLATQARKYYLSDLTANCPVDFANDPSLKTTYGGKVRAIMPSLVDYGVTANLAYRKFGYSMVSVGDVNKDGYEDFLISTPSESLSTAANVGLHYIYYGPLCPADNHNQITGEFQTSGNLNSQRFFKGQLPPLVSSAYESNVTIADTSITNSCFRGASSKMKPMPQKFVVLGADANQYWGYGQFSTQKGKGDFNLDGYDDVIVGSPYVADDVNAKTQLGRGVVFFGSETGLYTADFPAANLVQTSSGQIRPFAITPKIYNSGSRFFEKMGSTGDVNGDGTLDIMVPSDRYNGLAPFIGVNIGAFLIFN